MGFAYPAVLSLLVLPATLLTWEWKRRGTCVVLPFDHARQKKGGGLDALLRAAQSLPPLLLTVAILLLAGPQQLTEPRNKRVLTNIEFCLDVSGSMISPFGKGTRYDASMEAINDFIDYRQGDAYGLTIFGSSVLHWVPLTTDPSAFRCAHPFLSPLKLPEWFGGGTMMGLGLMESMKVLKSREEGDRMIILISDGYSYDLAGGNAETIGRQLKENNIIVYTVHVADGPPPPELSTVTGVTGGGVFSAGDPEVLKTVFKRIDQMKVTRLEKTAPETRDFFFPYTLTGLSLLTLCNLFLLGVRTTPW